jgi:glycosyltransferase involved in cell wall biosynthesis
MFVTNSITGGGAERSMNLVTNELFDRGWPVSLVPINFGGSDQVNLRCEVFPQNRQWRGGALDTVRALWRFNKTVRSWDPDIIVLNCDLPEMFGAMLPSFRTLVVIEHSSIPWIQRVRLGKIVRRMLRLRGVTWVSVSSHISIWPNLNKAQAILQNPLQSIGHSDIPKEQQRIARLIFIGRFSLEKHPEIALEIGATTRIALEFIGDGELRHFMEAQAREDSIRSQFRGQVQDPWQGIQAGDLLIVPSATEGDGLVVLEGLQHEIPMLVSDIPAFRRFGFPEANYCLEISDFVSRIQEYGNNLESLKVPVEIAKGILQERELSAVGDSWEGFINQLAESPFN